ncbi:hypothetical protein H5410_031645 [Solanum commersonii]|uniref:Uncharacterized protein n=1 Tax=Solanum commersonii TaxID=4109 RepID=A0A9J5YHR4_SOLCO|nr:hypothetical protein H5410_031645 [Solanum commersonii]
MSQRALSVVTTQSFAGVASSSNIKCSFCRCKGVSNNMIILLVVLKNSLIFLNFTAFEVYEVEKEKINDYYSSIFLNRKRQGEREREREKKRKRKTEKEKKVVSCDVKQQYQFEVFNIVGEGPTELMSTFSQWINEGLYKHHAKKRDKDDHYLVNCSKLGFKQLNFVVAST